MSQCRVEREADDGTIWYCVSEWPRSKHLIHEDDIGVRWVMGQDGKAEPVHSIAVPPVGGTEQ